MSEIKQGAMPPEVLAAVLRQQANDEALAQASRSQDRAEEWGMAPASHGYGIGGGITNALADMLRGLAAGKMRSGAQAARQKALGTSSADRGKLAEWYNGQMAAAGQPQTPPVDPAVGRQDMLPSGQAPVDMSDPRKFPVGPQYGPPLPPNMLAGNQG
jgi:hypothetical protein